LRCEQIVSCCFLLLEHTSHGPSIEA
jgi:hypothetical protein